MDRKSPKEISEIPLPNIKNSIARVVSLKLAILVTLVTLFASISSYFYSMTSTENVTHKQLINFIIERGMRDSAVFLESDAYQLRFQKEYVERYNRMGNKSLAEWFEEHMEKRQEDGTYRSKPELYYGKDKELGRRDVSASMMIGAETKLTPEVIRALAIGYDMINQYGPAWREPFVDLYFSSPEKTSVSRWPGTPWGLMMDDKVEWREEEWFAITTIANNPERRQRWSGVLYDERNGNWMVSGVTPLDIDGKQVGMVGTDLMLDDLVKRTINETLPGTYNILMQVDGRVIAHPDKIEEIITNKGMLFAQTSSDVHLRRIYELARTVTTFPQLIESTTDDEHLTIARIHGPGWFFITVHPRSLLKAGAMRAAGFVFLLGMVSLVIMFVTIRLILKRNLVYPLGQFTQTVRNFELSQDQWTDNTDMFDDKTSTLSARSDEIGLLASSFANMSDHLQTTYRALTNSEEKYRRFFDTVNNGWVYHKIVTDADNRPIDYVFLEVNNAYERLTGLARDEIIDRRLTELLPAISEDSTDWIGIFGEVAINGTACSFESFSECFSKWFAISATCPEPGYFIVVIDDITARKRSEEMLDWELHVNKELAELGNLLIVPGQSIKDVTEQVLASAQRLTASEHGYVSEIDRVTGDNVSHTLTVMMDNAGKITGTDQRIVFPLGDDGKYSKLWGHALNTGEPFFTNAPPDHPHASGLPEGHVPIIRFLSMPVTYAGEVIGQIALANPPSDYTDRHLEAIKHLADLYALAVYRQRSKEDRIQMEAHLQQAHKMEAIGTMAGGIAHDFNNQLAIIIGNTDIVQHKCSNVGSNSQKNIEHIREAANRATDLVKQILSFSRQEKQVLVPVNLSFSIDASVKLLRSTTPSTVEILNTAENDHIYINADTTQLQQIFLNLCNNAAHAMDEKGLLSINLEEVELAGQEIIAVANQHAGRYAKLSISDTGSGMTKETIGKIFDPFFTTKAIGEGTGMGLSVVHGIVELYGGFISVDSRLGQGSSFNIFFPIINEIGEEEKTEAGELLPIGTERILFVDDEEHIADVCTDMLEQQGYKVTGVTNSIEALNSFSDNPDLFDLVFTDQAMPEMSGAELAVNLLKIRPDIPIILCSGYSAKVSEADAKRIGIREFCMKPMDIEQLARVARRVLDEP